jgi:hypothetical protein
VISSHLQIGRRSWRLAMPSPSIVLCVLRAFGHVSQTRVFETRVLVALGHETLLLSGLASGGDAGKGLNLLDWMV